MEVILAGIQGSGKGTQGQRLIEEFKYKPIVMGDACRAIAKQDTPLGQEVKKYMDQGLLAPNEIVGQVLEQSVGNETADQRLLFDGYPRNVEQAHVFDSVMKQRKREAMCFHFLLDDQTAYARLKQRAEIEKRPDDMDDTVIQKRIETFKAQTLPVVEHYRERGQLIEIDARPPIQAVYKHLRCIIYGLLVD